MALIFVSSWRDTGDIQLYFYYSVLVPAKMLNGTRYYNLMNIDIGKNWLIYLQLSYVIHYNLQQNNNNTDQITEIC